MDRAIVRALGDGGALQPLLRLTGDPHGAVRREASEAAKRIEERLIEQNRSGSV